MAISVIGGSDTYNLLKEGVDASSVRAKAISNNIANINTENYKRFNVVFEDNINGTNKSSLALRKTNQRHIDTNSSSSDITVERDNSTSMRTDGNNVDLDVEKVNQAANTMKYYSLVQMANGKLSTTKYVIEGGR